MTRTQKSSRPDIRSAQPGDAPLLSALAERTFRDAFGDFNTPADMDLHCNRFYSPSVQEREISDPDTHTLVAEHEEGLIGYAQLHRGEAPPCVRGTAPIELRRFYVRAAWHGTGLARDLMDAAIAHAAADGADVLWLGVWERNPRAIGFYRKCGFDEVGEQAFVLGTDPQRDRVMAASISTTANRAIPR